MSNRRKVAVVIPKFGLVGGAEQFAKELTYRIAETGLYDVHVFANKWVDEGKQISFHRIPIIRFPRSLTTISFARFAAARIRGVGDFDIVHAHDRMFRADVYTMHGVPHRFWVREVRRKRMSLFDRGTDFVESRLINGGECGAYAVVSGLVKEVLLGEFPGIDEKTVHIIHPGANAAALAADDAERKAVRRSFGVGENEILVLFVSMNFEIKGLDLLLRSLGKLKKMSPRRFRLLVAGKGDQKKYGWMAQELGIGDDVVFAGVVKNEKMPGIYRAGDIFSMLSKFDTFGMAALEAMAASVPVLISDRVGARDLVADGANGFVIGRESPPEKAAEKIAAIADNMAAMSENALRTAEGYTWERAAERTTEIYEEIIKSRR